MDYIFEGGIYLAKKIFIIGLLVLFIGVGIQPVFADFPFESEKFQLEEVKIEFYDVDRCYEHKVMLTKEQVRELKKSIKKIEFNLNSTENKVEKEKIYNNAIVTFNEYDLLPEGISIDYAQRVITGKNHNPWIVKSIEKWYGNKKGSSDTDENFNCFISGYLEESSFMGPIGRYWLNIKDRIDKYDNYDLLLILLYILFLPSLIYIFTFGTTLWTIHPFAIGYEIGVGTYTQYPDGSDGWSPARGYINTTGLNGTKNWNGNRLWGAIPRSSFLFLNLVGYPGVVGFTGLKLGFIFSNNFIGNALWVKIKVGNKPL